MTVAGARPVALQAAGFVVHQEDPDSNLSELFYGFDRDMRELRVRRDGRSLVLSLGRLDRLCSPIVMGIGPVLRIDDVVASKAAALVSRREVRDYIDGAAVLGRYSLDQLLDLAHQHDPSLEPADVILVGAYLDRLSDECFQRYALGP
ncbi:hypothetical protein HC028_00885 [Planosporangium flavigriseum]|uniref:Uncharacterized protein n=1 Tax=Planosporangium flavigriseum TaxID=373681 RepID=A0A8J3LPG1_9ACTN|nr:hypothetical protein [Planosporangium flavigriseum]NJC63078.1 hypothetical protein [Planosporangium flavigriseum]GIG74450.1 hypothetical protein Pfl04_28540 [Planosporangium flavigriseum]